jgi:chromosome partitioning protein
MLLTIGNLKGGVAKSTTALFIALYLALVKGRRVLLVDADPLSQTATDWVAVALAAGLDVPVTIITLTNPDTLARQVRDLAPAYDDVVIDTGGEHDLIFRAALMVTDQLIVPVTPSPAELRRLPATFTVAAQIDAISAVAARVLLVRVRKNTRALAEALDLLAETQLPVMETAISLWQHYSDAYGTIPTDFGEYPDAVDELLKEAAA